jgi:hypothetical protein
MDVQGQIAKAIIGAGAENATQGQWLSARRQADRVIAHLGFTQEWAIHNGSDVAEVCEDAETAEDRLDSYAQEWEIGIRVVGAWLPLG